MYKCLLFKDPFNYVGISTNSEGDFDDYRVQIEHVLNKTEAKYFKLILITFIRKLGMIKDELEEEYQTNKMKLFL